MTKPTAEERFWARVDKGDGTGCWLWTGPVWKIGYGSIMVNGKATRPHRYSYELHVAQIPPGFHVDHLCRNRACVRPDHLEPVTLAENVLRGAGCTARNALKTVCPEGHPYDRVDQWNGARYCSVCKNRNHLARYHARRALLRAERPDSIPRTADGDQAREPGSSGV